MRLWLTEIKAICPETGMLQVYSGPPVPGINKEDAQAYCNLNGLGYCKVIGELIMVVEGNIVTRFENLN